MCTVRARNTFAIVRQLKKDGFKYIQAEKKKKRLRVWHVRNIVIESFDGYSDIFKPHDNWHR